MGKSVIFGLLTGKYVTVSNYPGTTVEVTSGNISLEGKRLVLIDTPGVNSLIPMSEDEKVTRDILLSECPSAVVQVGDAKNLKRTLLITLQIAEMGLPMTLDLNMIDEAMDKGITIDVDILKGLLGIDIVSTIAPQKKGIKELREAMLSPQRAAVRLSLRSHYRRIYLEDFAPAAPDGIVEALYCCNDLIGRRKPEGLASCQCAQP